jgi:hypothetical protein
MIEVFIAFDASLRQKKKAELLKKYPAAILIDETRATSDTIRAHAYPSLFEPVQTVVIATDVITTIDTDVTLLKELAASPSVFYMFERALSTDIKKTLSKFGSVTVLDTKPVQKTQSSLFTEASALVSQPNKLKRWQQFQQLLQTQVPEAFIGIMYWKLRDMALKGNASSKAMYDALITAHADAWIHGVPLAGAIEKVLLS